MTGWLVSVSVSSYAGLLLCARLFIYIVLFLERQLIISLMLCPSKFHTTCADTS